MLIIDLITLIIFFIGVYYLGIAFFSFFPDRKRTSLTQINKFNIVIPAHNEERVLKNLLESIKNAAYPKECINVFVIADGCSDKTAELSASLGAQVIIKEKSTTKGDALAFAFKDVGFLNTEFDYVAVFDADNVLDERFFVEMNEKINCGFCAVQGYVDSKNPDASWISSAHSMWYFISNRISQTGRDRLNISAKLNGTGFVLKKDILSHIPWQTKTMAEDTEYTFDLYLKGIKVGYAEKAIVYDEKPTDFKASVIQRKRWAEGMRDVQGEYTLKLILKAHINGVLLLWNDILSVLTPFLILFLAVSNISIWQLLSFKISAYIFVVFYLALSLLALICDKKAKKNVILKLFAFLIYILSWIFVGALGVLSKKNSSWKHTRHGV